MQRRLFPQICPLPACATAIAVATRAADTGNSGRFIESLYDEVTAAE